jgi:membrane-anchored protein YejM (alkaline phosphatase superfamily)
MAGLVYGVFNVLSRIVIRHRVTDPAPQSATTHSRQALYPSGFFGFYLFVRFAKSLNKKYLNLVVLLQEFLFLNPI